MLSLFSRSRKKFIKIIMQIKTRYKNLFKLTIILDIFRIILLCREYTVVWSGDSLEIE